MLSRHQSLIAIKIAIKAEGAIVIIDLLFFVLGVFIGINWRNEYAERKESRQLSHLDTELRNELVVAKNLNKSLLDDVKFLRAKIQRLQNINDK